MGLLLIWIASFAIWYGFVMAGSSPAMTGTRVGIFGAWYYNYTLTSDRYRAALQHCSTAALSSTPSSWKTNVSRRQVQEVDVAEQGGEGS
jgi:hypothetical protein